MGTVREDNEELASFIADADRLEIVIEAFRAMDRKVKVALGSHEGQAHVFIEKSEYQKFKSLIDDE